MFRCYADSQTAAMLPCPARARGDKATIIACPCPRRSVPSRRPWWPRYEAIRSGKVKPWEDNALAITTDGRKLALDARCSRHGGGLPRLQDQCPGGACDRICAHQATRSTSSSSPIWAQIPSLPVGWLLNQNNSLRYWGKRLFYLFDLSLRNLS